MLSVKRSLSFLLPLLLCGCAVKPLSDGELALVHNEIIVEGGEDIDSHAMLDHVAQKPTRRSFSFKKTKPVILDTALTAKSCQQLTTYMNNRGYLDAHTAYDIIQKGRKAAVFYRVTPNSLYDIRNISYDIQDMRIDSLLRAANVIQYAPISSGAPFSVQHLQEQRKRIASWLNNNGYMLFNKENITFSADSSRQGHFVDLTMHIDLYRRNSSDSFHNHHRYFLRNVTFETPLHAEVPLRAHTLDINSFLKPGRPYSAEDMQQTYNKFSRLRAIRATNISYNTTEYPDSLDAVVQLTPRKKHSIQLQPEGTNTAGDFGAAMSVIYENRNVFRGSEVFSLQARAAFEAISGLEGYSNSNYEEYGLEAQLTFPEFIIPGISEDFQRRHNATTELLVSYNTQNRPEFHRRVFAGRWRYKWTAHKERLGYSFDILDLNYISMPWISATFKHDYLDSLSNRNAILRYNYEDLFIMKTGFGIKTNTDNYSLRANIEAAGNFLYGLSQIVNMPTNADGKYKALGIAFAQYVKFDLDYTRLLRFDTRNILALHGRFGIAIPYGNSNILPFEKRYFSGGANSVRGWNVRTLGPGGYISKDGRINFLTQTGDLKLDLNAEWRYDLFWKFQGALFIDAGNIWNLRSYADQEGGLFRFADFIDQIAVAYGVGLRLNFDYFILRLDLGMKAINPAYTNNKEHYPITNHRFSRDYALHFAVGLPF